MQDHGSRVRNATRVVTLQLRGKEITHDNQHSLQYKYKWPVIEENFSSHIYTYSICNLAPAKYTIIESTDVVNC